MWKRNYIWVSSKVHPPDPPHPLPTPVSTQPSSPPLLAHPPPFSPTLAREGLPPLFLNAGQRFCGKQFEMSATSKLLYSMLKLCRPLRLLLGTEAPLMMPIGVHCSYLFCFTPSEYPTNSRQTRTRIGCAVVASSAWQSEVDACCAPCSLLQQTHQLSASLSFAQQLFATALRRTSDSTCARQWSSEYNVCSLQHFAVV